MHFEPVFWDATDFARTQGQYSCLCSFSAMVYQKGYDSSAFQQFFNSDQLNSFIANHQQDAASQYAAKRLLQQYPNVAFQSVVTKFLKERKFPDLTGSFEPVCFHLYEDVFV